MGGVQTKDNANKPKASESQSLTTQPAKHSPEENAETNNRASSQPKKDNRSKQEPPRKETKKANSTKKTKKPVVKSEKPADKSGSSEADSQKHVSVNRDKDPKKKTESSQSKAPEDVKESERNNSEKIPGQEKDTPKPSEHDSTSDKTVNQEANHDNTDPDNGNSGNINSSNGEQLNNKQQPDWATPQEIDQSSKDNILEELTSKDSEQDATPDETVYQNTYPDYAFVEDEVKDKKSTTEFPDEPDQDDETTSPESGAILEEIDTEEFSNLPKEDKVAGETIPIDTENMSICDEIVYENEQSEVCVQDDNSATNNSNDLPTKEPMDDIEVTSIESQTLEDQKFDESNGISHSIPDVIQPSTVVVGRELREKIDRWEREKIKYDKEKAEVDRKETELDNELAARQKKHQEAIAKLQGQIDEKNKEGEEYEEYYQDERARILANLRAQGINVNDEGIIEGEDCQYCEEWRRKVEALEAEEEAQSLAEDEDF